MCSSVRKIHEICFSLFLWYLQSLIVSSFPFYVFRSGMKFCLWLHYLTRDYQSSGPFVLLRKFCWVAYEMYAVGSPVVTLMEQSKEISGEWVNNSTTGYITLHRLSPMTAIFIICQMGRTIPMIFIYKHKWHKDNA